MKIFAIGRNYSEHIKELNNEKPTNPVVFMKPQTALIRRNKPFFYPDFSKDIHYEVEIVLRICKVGKHVQTKFAHTYYDSLGLGIDFTARDLQSDLKNKGLPWEIAKGFDGSAPLSPFYPKTDFPDLENINFSLEKNGEIQQNGNTSMMIFSFDQIISYVSRFFTLQKGDLIFTGTPQGVGPVKIGDSLIGKIENKKVIQVDVK